jgi:uncharacterized protein YjiK
MKNTLLLLLLSGFLHGQQAIKLHPVKSFNVPVAEPSDIAYNSKSNTFFVVSDKGALYELSANFSLINKLYSNLSDPEAVFVSGDTVWVAEERSRLVRRIIKGIETRSIAYSVPYDGGRNKGYESLCRLPNGNMLLLTERDPIWAIELDTDFREKHRIELNLKGDVSAAAVWNNSLFLLSDEGSCIYKVSYPDYTIQNKYTLPIINPEGMCFGPDGTLWILSDAEHKVYQFEAKSW